MQYEPSQDKLIGLKSISKFYTGDPDNWRKVNNWIRRGRFPYYKDGSVYCASKRTITAWVIAQQQLAIEGLDTSPSAILKRIDELLKDK